MKKECIYNYNEKELIETQRADVNGMVLSFFFTDKKYQQSFAHVSY